jgi:hypothetical protein
MGPVHQRVKVLAENTATVSTLVDTGACRRIGANISTRSCMSCWILEQRLAALGNHLSGLIAEERIAWSTRGALCSA